MVESEGKGDKRTALLNPLNSRLADGLIDGIDRIFDRGAGIFLRGRGCGEEAGE